LRSEKDHAWEEGASPLLPLTPFLRTSEAGGGGGVRQEKKGGQKALEAKGPAGAPPVRLCVPVVEESARRARGVYLRAARKKCWAELRLDYLEQVDLRRLLGTQPGPVVVTNRHPAEGGRWRGEEAARLKVLEEALAFRPTCVDVEWRTEAGWRRELAAAKGPSRLILSWHDFSGTPEESLLLAQWEAMLAAEADILKMVTLARTPEDNLRVLGLIPRTRAAGREIIAFCMGPAGSWSRVAAAFLGSYLTYAPFHRKGASAPGQLTVNEVRRIWRLLRW